MEAEVLQHNDEVEVRLCCTWPFGGHMTDVRTELRFFKSLTIKGSWFCLLQGLPLVLCCHKFSHNDNVENR